MTSEQLKEIMHETALEYNCEHTRCCNCELFVTTDDLGDLGLCGFHCNKVAETEFKDAWDIMEFLDANIIYGDCEGCKDYMEGE